MRGGISRTTYRVITTSARGEHLAEGLRSSRLRTICSLAQCTSERNQVVNAFGEQGVAPRERRQLVVVEVSLVVAEIA